MPTLIQVQRLQIPPSILRLYIPYVFIQSRVIHREGKNPTCDRQQLVEVRCIALFSNKSRFIVVLALCSLFFRLDDGPVLLHPLYLPL